MPWARWSRLDTGAWNTWTISVTSSGTQPTYGSSPTRTGYYTQIGKAVFCRFLFKWGTSPTAGSGSYNLSLPVTAVTGHTTSPIGHGYIVDVSAAYISPQTYYLATTTTFTSLYSTALNAGYSTMAANAPYTLQSSDTIEGFLVYEAA